MKLSDLQKIINEAVKLGREDKEHTLAEDPNVIFSIGKPTDNKLVCIVSAGIAGNSDNEPVMFLELKPKNNALTTLRAMMTEFLGEDKANEIIEKARIRVQKEQEKASTNEKVDAIVRVQITGIADQDAFAKGFRGVNRVENTPYRTVIGLVGDFKQRGNSIPGYTAGNFLSDDGEFNHFFHAVQVKEIPEKTNDPES